MCQFTGKFRVFPTLPVAAAFNIGNPCAGLTGAVMMPSLSKPYLQVIGALADHIGRRRGSLLTSVIMLVGAVLLMASHGSKVHTRALAGSGIF